MTMGRKLRGQPPSPQKIPRPASPQDEAAVSGLGHCGGHATKESAFQPLLPSLFHLPPFPDHLSQPLHLPNPDNTRSDAHRAAEKSGDPEGGSEDKELQKSPEETGAESEGLKSSGTMETRRGGTWVWGRAGLSFGAGSVHSPLMPPDILRKLPFPILGGPPGRRECSPLTTSFPLSCSGKPHWLTKSEQSRAGRHVVRK